MRRLLRQAAHSALICAMLLVPLCAAQAAEDGTFTPEGYRDGAYRAPVPSALEGVTVVDDDAAYALWKTDKVAFIDVLPRPPRPKLPEGTIFREKPRKSIPGALWLPNVGYGRIAEVTDSYFRHHLKAATAGDKDAPLLFFCLADCWMSWNAARRAREDYGYTHIFWYPEGTDGWDFADYPLAVITRTE